tara:strand:- start:14951 stop:15148 length:198 start_codon:yes stop_codon:yes gene_type:complete
VTFNVQGKLTKTFSIFIILSPQEVIDYLHEHGFALPIQAKAIKEMFIINIKLLQIIIAMDNWLFQ